MISYYRDGEERSMQANPSTWKYSSKKKVLGNITKSKAGTLLHQYIPKLYGMKAFLVSYGCRQAFSTGKEKCYDNIGMKFSSWGQLSDFEELRELPNDPMFDYLCRATLFVRMT